MRNFIKRFIPFLLTFAAGLVVASFFVTVAAPKFQFNKRSGKHNKCRYHKNENERLRRENERLKRELAEREAMDSDLIYGLEVPPPPPIPAVPLEPTRPARR